MSPCARCSASLPGRRPDRWPWGDRPARAGGHPWGPSRACPDLAMPSPTPWVPPRLGRSVLRLLWPQRPQAMPRRPLSAPVRVQGPRSVSSGRGAVSTWALTRPRRPPGCPKGFYGKHCRKKCHCANRGRCHRVYGACLCDPGLYGRFCHLGESPCPRAARGRALGCDAVPHRRGLARV